jgi:hypothetical protein
VAQRLVVGQRPGPDLERPLGPPDGAEASAGGAGLLLPQPLGLLAQEGGEGSLGESGGGGRDDLFHDVEIDIEPGSVVAEGGSGNDLAPTGGEFADLLEFLG